MRLMRNAKSSFGLDVVEMATDLPPLRAVTPHVMELKGKGAVSVQHS